MKKFYLLLLTMFLSLAVTFAQPKKVGYFTFQKDMDGSAASVQLDPIIRMLQADTNFLVTVIATTATDTADLSGYDVVVVQESYNSGAAILTPKGALGLHTIPVPFVYNKSYAMRNGRGFTGNAAGSGAETEGVGNVYLRVNAANQANDLFKGVTFAGDSVAIFKTACNDAGVSVNPDRHKALNYARAVAIVDAGTKDTLDNTLLGVPAVINAAHTDVTISVNDIPAGTQISVDTNGNGQVLQARMIALGMNFGAICGAYGSNMTAAGLTIWRNAVYIAAGLEVPAEPAEFQGWKIGVFTLAGKVMVSSAAPANQDPIFTMLSTGNDQWEVEMNEVAADSVFDLDSYGYDAVIVQESFNSTAAVLMPNGSLGLEKFTMPFIYNKSYALRDGRGFDGGASGSGAELEGVLKLKVLPENQTNPLFSGIAFAADSTTQLVYKGADDSGGATRTKAMNYATAVKLTDTLGTRLGLPVGAPDNATVGTVSDIPAGDSIGSEKLNARMIAIGQNFGGICRDKGFNLTSAGLTLWRNAVLSALGLPIPKTAVPSVIPAVNILLVANPNGRDEMQYKFLTNNNQQVTKFYPSRPLGLITDSASLADTVAMLNSYDLVILGRSGASTDFADPHKAIWNSLNVPVILNSQWIARNTRINWFNSSDSKNFSAATETVPGTVLDPDDPIFDYATIEADNTIQWSYLPDDILSVTAPFNGDTVLYRADAPLVVRFWEDSAFYPGSADTVVAPRTFFGFGADGNNYNFFPLTKSGQAAYFAEILRITGNPVLEPIYYVSDAASILSVTVTETDMTPAAFDPAVLNYTIIIPKDVTVDSVGFIVSASPLATVTGGGWLQLTSDSVVHRVYATAENKRIGQRYTFTIMKEKEPDGFEDLTEAGIIMFPNPASDNLTINGLKEKSVVRIMNAVGQLVYSNQLEGSKAVINVSSFDDGIYILQIELNGKIVTTKFVKQ